MANFHSYEDVQRWVDKHGLEALRDAVQSSIRFHPDNRAMAIDWLRDAERLQRIAKEDEQHEFARRQTVAAEDQASTARQALCTSRVALVAAVAALLVSAWPFIK